MNFIKKILLILFVLFCPVGTLAYDAQNSDSIKQTTVTAPKHIEKDFIKNDLSFFHVGIVKSNSNFAKRLSKASFGGLDNENIILEISKNNFNSENKGLGYFLDIKSKTIISLLSFQIQPNAP